MNQPHQEIVGYALGLLEPGDAMVLSEGLQGDVAGSFHVAGISAHEGVPGPGPAVPAPAVSSHPARTLRAGEQPRPGDRFTLLVRPPVSAETARCVVFHQAAGTTRLLHPVPGHAWPTLDRFRLEGEERLLDLVLTGPPGRQAYLLVLVPAEVFVLPWEAGDARWDDLRQRAEQGGLPSRWIEVQVGFGHHRGQGPR